MKMNPVRIGSKAIVGLSDKLRNKQVMSLTPSEVCRVVRACSDGSSLDKTFIKGVFKNGEVFANVANTMCKFFSESLKLFGIALDEKMISGKKFTEIGKKACLEYSLEKLDLPKTASVKDITNFKSIKKLLTALGFNIKKLV